MQSVIDLHNSEMCVNISQLILNGLYWVHFCFCFVRLFNDMVESFLFKGQVNVQGENQIGLRDLSSNTQTKSEFGINNAIEIRVNNPWDDFTMMRLNSEGTPQRKHKQVQTSLTFYWDVITLSGTSWWRSFFPSRNGEISFSLRSKLDMSCV